MQALGHKDMFGFTPKNITEIALIIVFSILLMCPTAFNGVRQYIFGIESTNKKRILTGISCGIGIYLFVSILTKIIL